MYYNGQSSQQKSELFHKVEQSPIQSFKNHSKKMLADYNPRNFAISGMRKNEAINAYLQWFIQQALQMSRL